MTKRSFLAVTIAFSLLAVVAAIRAEAQCVGDCNNDGEVPVSELILVVNIAGGSMPLTACSPGVIDTNGNGSADVDELVTAVVSSLSVCDTVPLPTFTPTPSPTTPSAMTPTPTPSTGPAVCGNGAVEGDEECDDGAQCVGAPNRKACTQQSDCAQGETCRASGGDECASNCTDELRRIAELNPCPTPIQLIGKRNCAGANLSAQFLTNVELPLNGTQVLTAGDARDSNWVDLAGQTNDAMKIPIVIKAKDVQFDPINVFGLFCACVVPVPEQIFGIGLEGSQEVGISGSGFLGCNAEGLTDVNFLIEQDHNTTPGDPGNSGTAMGLPDDPECDDVLDVGEGLTSSACKEHFGEACDGDTFLHFGSPTQACNSPRKFTFSGGPAGRGSVLLRNQTALKLLAGAPPDACVVEQGETCPVTFGPDCMPCTDDDLPDDEPVANNTPTTSGLARVLIYDFRNKLPGPPDFGPGVTLEQGAQFCPPSGVGCVTEVEGTAADCDSLLDDPCRDDPQVQCGALTGVLATAFPGLDASNTGDSVTTTSLAAKQPTPTTP